MIAAAAEFALERRQTVARRVDDAFAFFSDPWNLEAITPPWLCFRIVDAPAELRPGALLRYRLRLFGLPIGWLTEIADWRPPRSFTDRQLAGPYVLWEHTHRFTPVTGGTEIYDHVRYRLPGGPAAPLLHRLAVGRWLDEIFAYRAERLAALLASFRARDPGNQADMRFTPCATAAAVALGVAAPADASIWVANDARAADLRVDARGYAEVSWRGPDGTRRTLLIPPRGRVLPGGRLRGANVARTSSEVAIPLKRVLKRTPDGRFWALQAWRVLPGGPVELHFSRWRGSPTTVTARVAGERLTGEARFQGSGVYGRSPTPEGKLMRLLAYVDCFGCPGRAGWTRLLGVFLRGPRGSFAVFLRASWRGERYRVTVAGPNRGTTLAPDAVALVTA